MSALPPLPIDARLVFPDLVSRTRDEVLNEMASRMAAAGVVKDPADLAERLRRREREGCTGLGKEGVAFPHCRMQGISDVVVAIGLSADGVDFGTADGRPIRLLFLILSPWDAPALHLQVLARLARLAARTPGLPELLRAAGTPEAIVQALRDTETSAGAAATA